MAALTKLQSEVLRRFFERRQDFFLTGGGALVGFHLRHRVTHDLDLFTVGGMIDDAERTLGEIATELGARMQTLRRAPTFRRFLIEVSSESVIVDLVRDEAPQVHDKITIDGIVVDPPEEILANKLCTLLSRTEVRDLVDVKTLEAAGHDVLEALLLAEKKDGGVSASQLAWVLSTFPIPTNDAELHGVSRDELQQYRDSLIKRLSALAYPRS